MKRIRVHTMTDGRDVDDGSSVRYMKRLTTDLQKLGEQGVDAKVASGGGRMRVTMDRYEVCGHAVDTLVWSCRCMLSRKAA